MCKHPSLRISLAYSGLIFQHPLQIDFPMFFCRSFIKLITTKSKSAGDGECVPSNVKRALCLNDLTVTCLQRVKLYPGLEGYEKRTMGVVK